MAKAKHSADLAHNSAEVPELMASVRPWSLHWELEGTRAQLQDEGAVSEATQWPTTGTQAVEWTAGELAFTLRRVRPTGMKGPMRHWAGVDWWMLSCDPVSAPNWKDQEAEQATHEAEHALRDFSIAGELELARCVTADMDDEFQAFKALIPALNPRRRGRRAAGAGG